MRNGKYRLLSVFMILASLALAPSQAVCAAECEISIFVDGRRLETDVPPVIINNRTMVPVRAVSEATGYGVEWLPDAEAVAVYKPGTKEILIGLTINDPIAYVYKEDKNGEKVTLDSPAVLINGRTMAPLRFIAETLGFTVDWEDASRAVFLTGGGNRGQSAPNSYTDAELRKILSGGEWMKTNVVGACYNARYVFNADGTFIYGFSQYDQAERQRFRFGAWSVENGALLLTTSARIRAEGGLIVETPEGVDMIDANFVLIPETISCVPDQYAVGVEGGDPEGSGRFTINLNGVNWYNYIGQELFEDCGELLALIQWTDPFGGRAPEFEVQNDIIYASDSEKYFWRAGGTIQKGAYFHDGRGEWLTYYYVEVGPGQYKFLSGQESGNTGPLTVQVYSTDYDLDGYLGRFINFSGDYFEAHTIYHRCETVLAIEEIYGFKSASS